MEEVFRLGYKRPGLVIERHIDANVEYRFSAGFTAGLHLRPRVAGLPASPRAAMVESEWVAGTRCGEESPSSKLQVPSKDQGDRIQIPRPVRHANDCLELGA
jgi:hypothetical protein